LGRAHAACISVMHAWLLQVGRALRRDMERAGIHLAGAARARLDGLTARTHELGLMFGMALPLARDEVVACLVSYLQSSNSSPSVPMKPSEHLACNPIMLVHRAC